MKKKKRRYYICNYNIGDERKVEVDCDNRVVDARSWRYDRVCPFTANPCFDKRQEKKMLALRKEKDDLCDI